MGAVKRKGVPSREEALSDQIKVMQAYIAELEGKLAQYTKQYSLEVNFEFTVAVHNRDQAEDVLSKVKQEVVDFLVENASRLGGIDNIDVADENIYGC